MNSKELKRLIYQEDLKGGRGLNVKKNKGQTASFHRHNKYEQREEYYLLICSICVFDWILVYIRSSQWSFHTVLFLQ